MMDSSDSLFVALADRVFEEAAKFAPAVLRTALKQDLPDRGVFLEAAGDEGNSHVDLAEQGEAARTHRPFQPDPEKNIPHPGTLAESRPARKHCAPTPLRAHLAPLDFLQQGQP